MRSRSQSSVVVISLLLVALLSGGVLAEVETNYATMVQSDESTAWVTEAEQSEDGILFQIAVENHLNHPIRIDYVRLNITEKNRSVLVSVPFGERASVSPKGGTIEAFVSARRHERLSPIEKPLNINGYIVVRVFNNHKFIITVTESKVEL